VCVFEKFVFYDVARSLKFVFSNDEHPVFCCFLEGDVNGDVEILLNSLYGFGAILKHFSGFT